MGYYEDEFDYDDYYDQEPDRIVYVYLNKAANGHLVYEEIYYERYPGMDWGEVFGTSYYTNLNDLNPMYRKNAIELGKRMGDGAGAVEWYWVICPECGRTPTDYDGYCIFHTSLADDLKRGFEPIPF